MRHKKSLLVLFLVLSTSIALAQLHGTYTIKPSGGNYESFAAAAAALVSEGMSDDVIFEAYTGTYSGYANLSNITTGTHTITFRPATGQKPVLASGTTYGFYGYQTNNVKIENIPITASSYAIYAYYADNWRVEGCILRAPYPVRIYYYSDYDSIIGNRLESSSSYGVYMYGNSSTRGQHNFIANNFISGWTSYGVYCRYQDYATFYYNSIVGSGSYSFYLYYSDYVSLKNNIVWNKNPNCTILYTRYATLSSSDYNDLYYTGSSGRIAYYNNTYYYTLSSWQGTGFDAHSISTNPLCGGGANLHLKTGSPCIGKANPITGITTDIDGDTRGTPPDIGADEYTTAPGSPMSGVYTVKLDGTGNYKSVTDGLYDMYLRGVGGNITFDIYKGTYNEALNLQDLGNGSYSITFQAHVSTDGIDKVTWNAGGATYAVNMKDASHMRFKNLNVLGYRSYGFYFYYDYAQYPYKGCDSCLVEGCNVTGGTPIYMRYGCDDDSIIGNQLKATSSYGIYMYGTSSPYSYRNVVANNMISGFSSYAIYMYYTYYTKLYYNTIYSNRATYLIYDRYDYYTESKNNILFNNRNYTNAVAHYKYSGGTLTSDYNCLYCPYSNYVGYYNGYQNWSAWQGLGFDLHGINSDPKIGGQLNMHLKTGSPCIEKATPITGITTDIDGDTRGTPPDIGADEYTSVGAPMSGVYTIKQDGTGDFVDFLDALSATQLRGLSGDIYFDVYEGTYSDAIYLSTFNNGSHHLTFRADTSGGEIAKVTISNGTSYGVYLADVARFTFKDLIITGHNYGFYLGYISSPYRGCDSITIQNCKINAGSYGLYMRYGSSDNKIIGNEIHCTGSYGVYHYGSSSGYCERNEFINNFVYGYTNRGFYDYYTRNAKYYYNTLYSSQAFYCVMDYYGYGTTYKNNILFNDYNYTSGTAIYKYYGDAPTSDYNCLYCPYSNYVAYLYPGSGYMNWSAWQSAGYDTHGINSDPDLTSASDLHLLASSPCVGKATPITGITTDIDGDTRDATHPDIGGDEMFVDVAVTEILAPTGALPIGGTVIPRARVTYLDGRGTAIFDLIFRIFKGGMPIYTDTAHNITLDIGDVDTVSFYFWVPTINGADYSAQCWHSMTPDAVPGNDTAYSTFAVGNVDVGILEIQQPPATVAEGTVIYPTVKLHNYGDFASTFNLIFTIDDGTDQGKTTASVNNIGAGSEAPVLEVSGSTAEANVETDALVYNQSEPVTVNAGEDLVHTFTTGWTATPHQAFTVLTYHDLAFDQTRSNDTAGMNFNVVGVDIAAIQITEPTATVGEHRTIYPSVLLHNSSIVALTCDLTFTIDDGSDVLVYNETEPVTINAGEDLLHTFATGWEATPQQFFAAHTHHNLPYDANRTNDTIDFQFEVIPPWPERWTEVASMPAGAKPVKRGAWLAINGDGMMYATKGYKTCEFYRYDPIKDSWKTRKDVPANEEGRVKPPRKGCKGVSDGDRYIYMTKGNNTLGFWRYDIVGDTWERMTSVPEGSRRKKVKGGTDLAYVVKNDTAWVYLLKGYKTEFYKYDVANNAWTTLQNVPFGTREKYDKGSFLVYDGDNTLYAHQAKYYNKAGAFLHHHMFKYDVVGDSWYSGELNGMPLYGLHSGRIKKKKSKDGGSGAWYESEIYALKGGNTQQFWKYIAAQDTWQELDTVPTNGSTGRRKRVKYGADIVGFGGGAFFALKGNKTLEAWRYMLNPELLAARPERSGVMAGLTRASRFGLTITPNPLASGFATLRYSLPNAGPVSLSVFDVAGRVVRKQTIMATRNGATNLDLRTLSAGVYLVRFDADSFTSTHKLVVQH